MGLKYSIEYNDVVNINHRLEIYDDSYSGAEIEVKGLIFLDYASTDDPLEAIRGQGLRVQLEADTGLTFEDLYSEEQQTFPVIYERNSVTLFTGWLNASGWFEDFVNDKWKVSFDCIDGFSYLQDLSFVDADGFNVIGKFTMLEILVLALARTGQEKNINTDIQIHYTGISAVDILTNATVDAERYIKDDGETNMSCDEVIRDILEPFTACITSFNGEWYIYKPNQIFASATLSFYRYDFEGTALSPTTGTLDISQSLGSQINGFSLFHCSGNQSLSIRNSIGAYRIHYKYGQNKSLIDNPFLCTYDSGVTIDGWTIINATNLNFPIANDCGISLAYVAASAGIKQIETDLITLTAGIELEITTRAESFGTATTVVYIYQVHLNGASQYTLNALGEWVAGGTEEIRVAMSYFAGGTFQHVVRAQPLPINGDIKYIIWTPESFPQIAFRVEVNEVVIANISENTDINGEFHTVQRTTKPSREIKENKEVFTGDNEAENYVGAIYKVDGSTTTSTWTRPTLAEGKAILQIMGEDTLRMSANPKRIFKGDVFGYFPYLSRIVIDTFTGMYFMPIAYSYDTQANIMSIIFCQIFGAELTDIDYQVSLDYGNVVEPTIKG